MLKYFLSLIAMTVLPVGGYLVWLSTLPTEQQVLLSHQAEVDARLAQFPKVIARLPLPGSVTRSTLPARLDPPPVCDANTGECNLQIASTWMLEEPDQYARKVTASQTSGPSSLVDVLLYTVGQTLRPHARVQEKVWGFAGLIERGLQARYLLVNRYLNRTTAKGVENVAIEGFLVDLHDSQVLGSFRYPDWYARSSDWPRKNEFLTQTLGGTIAPQYGPRRAVRTGDIDTVTGIVVSYTAFLVLLGVISVPVAVVLRRQQRRLEERRAEGVYPGLLPCPACGQRTDSLKQFRLLRFVLFFLVAATWQAETVTACPRCMRQSIRRRFFWNLLPGNLVMLMLGPVLLFLYLRTFQSGHSLQVVDQLATQRAALSDP